MIELMLFERDGARARRAVADGIASFMVDWESADKHVRQRGFDTEIEPCSADDLAAIAAVEGGEAWCRVNAPGPATAEEVELAIAAGARGIFLPMVVAPREVDDVLGFVAGRCATGILVETVAATACAHELATLPIDRVYFGLNDFAIDRGDRSIFAAVRDGTVEAVRSRFGGTAFGFGGMTDVSAGTPVPAIRLLEEMARLDCAYTFLRRSFRRDSRTRPAGEIVTGIQNAWDRCMARDADHIRRDHDALAAVLDGLGA